MKQNTQFKYLMLEIIWSITGTEGELYNDKH